MMGPEFAISISPGIALWVSPSDFPWKLNAEIHSLLSKVTRFTDCASGLHEPAEQHPAGLRPKPVRDPRRMQPVH
jgi:hypothetical protein